VADQIEERVRRLFDAFGERILPVTREIAELWGELLAQSDKHVDDTGLVATARVHRLTMVTRNLKHVSGRGAMALDPFKPAPRITSRNVPEAQIDEPKQLIENIDKR
jgi:predicted nucleic acid-binding protein